MYEESMTVMVFIFAVSDLVVTTVIVQPQKGNCDLSCTDDMIGCFFSDVAFFFS